MDMQYVPLHVHSEYSLLDGAIRLKEICEFAKANNMPAVAITDHGTMYCAIEFYRTAKETGVRPIIGCEFYVHSGDLTEKDARNNPLYHLVLLAKDKTGYGNLIKLVSIAHCEGMYYKPRINFDVLKKHHEGLVCMSACLGGEVLQHLLNKNYDAAKKTAAEYKELFGDDYYIELQDHGLDEQKRTNPDLIKLAKELNIKMVITNDSHYLKREDADWHDTLLCLQTNALKSDSNRFHFANNEFYVKTPAQLREIFNWMDEKLFTECIENTVEISDKCRLMLEMGKAPLPDYEVPSGYTVESYLDSQVRKGLKDRYEKITPEIEERVKYELGIIEQMKFSAYFLITWDFIDYAKRNGIPVGPGRGSAAGSVVAYALGITDLDPLRHNLLFERFLNPERYSMPDVDIDFCIERRGEVIDYVAKKYGEDRVCQIITFGTYAAKAALKGVARVFNIPFERSNKISSMVPAELKATIDDALKPGMELRALYDTDDEIKKLVDMAKSIEGIKNNVGTHAAGVIISHKPLTELVPVQPSKDGIIVTEYPMADLEKLGLLKMDFLGLRNLTIIKNTLNLIKQRHGLDIDINKIPLDDKKVFEMLSRGETDGVFQLESSGMKQLVKQLKPDSFEDIGALVALFRPGPLQAGMVEDFVECKHGRKAITYPHDSLIPILKDTYGTIVYQEQIMQIFQVLAGYTLGQADMVRRMMGKKKVDEMAAQKDKFVEGAKRSGMDAKNATTLFEQIEKFAEYCFNRSHSAAYAFVAYQTAYLKCRYPVEYMAALLTSVSGNQDSTANYIEDAQKAGINVLPPDINKSYAEFTPDEGNIRFGLVSVKQVGDVVVENVIQEREQNGEFKSIYDFCTRVDSKCTNKGVLEGLIKSGAFDGFGTSRKQLMENLDSLLSSARRENQNKASGQGSLFAGIEDYNEFELTGSEEEYDTRTLQNFEKEFLGFYVSSHPLSVLRDKLPFLTTHKTSEINALVNEKPVTICGLVTASKQIPTKKDPTKFIKFVTVEDLSGKIEAVCFHRQLTEYSSLLEIDRRVIISGKVNRRNDDEPASIIVDSVKTVDNCNLFKVHLQNGIEFDELVALKNMLCTSDGSDPVILNIEDTQILANSAFWVNSSNDLVNRIQKQFSNRVEIEVTSIDAA